MIQVDNLCKTFTVHKKEPGLGASFRSLFRREYVEKRAVRGVSFKVGEGEIVGLVGANGAGKTTIVKMLAGVIYPTSGRASVLGYTPWERDNRFRRQIALIMGQKAQLWWDLPAGDCFLLLKEIYQIPDEQYRANLSYLAEVLEVGDELQVQIRRLSLGERMKMELIAALLHSPRVVYLDEPTIGLDLTAQRAIRDFILQYRAEHHPAMILTSHYMEDIERLCRRIIILREGEIVFDGSLDEVVARYAEHKVITVHLRKDGMPPPDPQALATLGELETASEDMIRLRVPRPRVAEAAADLLRMLPVLDLGIEEIDVGTIIERIQRAHRREDAIAPSRQEGP
jgi:ABC-2 type transport system ATP-binding protein